MSSLSPLERLLQAVADTLDVPESAYEQATERYRAVGEWLGAEGSALEQFHPNIYAQGSFALGTAVKPLVGDDYDIDAVVELDGPRDEWQPAALKKAVGDRIKAHGGYQKMLGPEGRRCWTLEYARESTGRGFHLDLLPSVTVGPRAPAQSQVAGRPTTAIAITNRESAGTFEWRESDPKGYATWFRGRMQVEFARRKKLLSEKYASIEAVPEYAVRTPLQYAVQLLKRFRDQMFGGSEDAPISVIVTTLAAMAYRGEETLADTLLGMVDAIGHGVRWDSGRPFIPNPVSPSENFADRWQGDPNKQQAFVRWLNGVKELGQHLRSRAPAQLEPQLAAILGESTAKTAMARFAAQGGDVPGTVILRGPSAAPLSQRRDPTLSFPDAWRNARHRKPLTVPYVESGTTVRLSGYVTGGRGWRAGTFASGKALTPGLGLRFDASVSGGPVDKLLWQVTNTGNAAAQANGLRGGFEEGGSSKSESTLYCGDHYIECFAITRGVCVARSGPFRVCIR